MIVDYLAESENLKQEGNRYLKDNDFQQAVSCYSQAIETALTEGSRVPKNKLSIYYANRSFAQIKLQNFGLAITDAQASISYNPEYQKAYLRLAFCKQVVQKYKQAYSAYLKAFELSGKKDQTIYQKLIDCKNQNQEQLRNRKLTLLHDDIQRGPLKEKPYKNWRQIIVEKQYTGISLDQKQQITSQWVIKMIQSFIDQKRLHKKYTLQLIERCRDILFQYPSLVDYKVEDSQDFTICGDIHGQYYDLVNIFKINGYPSINNKYLFNGDFVDRGSFSVECMLTLIAWKCVNKQFLHMTRGNHQAKQVNHIYGFKGEVQAKYKDEGVYEAFSELFCALPLAYVFNQSVIVCHGGLPSTDDIRLKDIKQLYRFVQPPQKGLICDLLWADPSVLPGRKPSKRGASMQFGPDITHKFLNSNDLKLIIRSHEVKMQGYEQTHDGRCITIFSAPNYCDVTKNLGAFIKLNGKTMSPKYTKFSAVGHPPVAPMAYSGQFKGMF